MRINILSVGSIDPDILEGISDYLGKMLNLEQHELDLKRQYTEELKTVISAKKILRLYTAERMFKERLLQAMNQRKSNFRD